MSHLNKLILLSLMVFLLITGFTFSAGQIAAGPAVQSTGDTLPTRSPTPHSSDALTQTPVSTATSTPMVWIGRLVSNTLGVTEGNGSIFRVQVDGLSGVPIELRTDDQLITGVSGSKPEYGPYTAEFAPVTEAVWTVSVPSLGVSLEVAADNYNLAVIEFTQIPAPAATRQVEPSPTATPLGGQNWTGRLVGETAGPGASSARLLVRVVGRDAQAVRLSTPGGVINTADTGQKPAELGPHTVEFAGLTPGKYIIEPIGLNSPFEVELKANTETRVEFQPLSPSPTPTGTASPPPPTFTPLPEAPTPTSRPTLRPSPTNTAPPSVTSPPPNTATPFPEPTPVTRWLGAIAERSSAPDNASSVAVKTAGLENLPVRLRAVAGPAAGERYCITGQESQEADRCDFENLKPGRYILSPEELGASLPLNLAANERVLAVFDLNVLPPGVTGWQSRVEKNTNEAQATAQAEGSITVIVEGQAGQVVALHSARGTEKICEVAAVEAAPERLACQFEGLRAGVYLVEAVNTGARQSLFVDGRGQAEVVFRPNATYATQALAQSPPVVGLGAQPRRPTPPATPRQTSTPPQPLPTRPPAADTPTPTATATPTPAFAWQGRVVERVNGVAGTIAVRAAGLPDHPVVLRSGDWQSLPQPTGSKPELGDYATEFGGLAQGEYLVVLVGLAEFTVDLGPDQFVLIEFRYDFAESP